MRRSINEQRKRRSKGKPAGPGFGNRKLPKSAGRAGPGKRKK